MMGIVRSSKVCRTYDSSLSDKERYCKVFKTSPNESSQAPRVLRDGKVAVIFHPDHGGRWYTRHENKALLFDPEIVALIERDAPPSEIFKHIKSQEAHNLAEFQKTVSPSEDDNTPWHKHSFSRIKLIHVDMCSDLAFRWVPVSSEFRINEYDGKETVVLKSEDNWITA